MSMTLPFSLSLSLSVCVVVLCTRPQIGPAVNSRWDFNPSTPNGMVGTFSLRSDASLCLASDGTAAAMLVLAPCNKAVSANE